MKESNTPELQKSLERTLVELETLSDSIRVRLHLAGMEANTTWNEKLEPRLFEARAHARDAKDVSKAVIDDAVKALREFAESL